MQGFFYGFPACNTNTRNEYLSDAYLATCILESALFLIIQCEVVPAAEEKRFLVADCVAIWLHQDDPLPNDLGFYGEFSIRKTSGQPSAFATTFYRSKRYNFRRGLPTFYSRKLYIFHLLHAV